MKKHYDDDLFKESTMTFGEHLEELRGCLFRAVVGLAIGFAVGLLVGKHVVRVIMFPLETALEDYLETRSIDKLKLQYGGEIPAEYFERISKEHLVFEQVYVNPVEILKALHDRNPAQFPLPDDGTKMQTSDDAFPKGLTPVYLWRKSTDVKRVIGMNPLEAFMVYMKASLLVGALLSGPWVFYQLWSFVAAGLYPHEKKYVHIFLPFSVLLFLGGAGLAFFVVFRPVLNFLFEFNAWLGIEPDPRISEWLSFVLFMPLGFGISFQLPLVMMFMQRIGIFNVDSYLAKWRIAVLVIFILAALLTPSPDPISMMWMAAPLTILYFGGIWLCHRFPGGSRAEEPQQLAKV